MNKDKDLIDAGDMKPKRPVNLTDRLFILKTILKWLRKQVTCMGGQMVIPVYAVVYEP